MGIFRRHEQEPDLSDEQLLSATENATATQESEDRINAEEEGATEQPAQRTFAVSAYQAETQSQDLTGEKPLDENFCTAEEHAEQEANWQQAVSELYRHWPQAGQNVSLLLGKMHEVSCRLGDETLWQRSPGSIMREAAIELYGMPAHEDASYSEQLRNAHEQGRREAETRRRDKAGLGAPQVCRSAPPPMTEDERIIQEMRNSRRNGIFR